MVRLRLGGIVALPWASTDLLVPASGAASVVAGGAASGLAWIDSDCIRPSILLVLVGNAGVLVTRVLYVKRSGRKTFVVVDAAMNDLVRPSFYDAHHEIEPVGAADFMRFLFRWQHVDPSSRLTGLDGLREIVASLDGYELAAGAWERAVLPARLDRYDPSMLDLICLAGEAEWGRLAGGQTQGGAAPVLGPATPIAIFLREHARSWRTLRTREDEPSLGEIAQNVLSVLRSRGASFFRDLETACGLDADRLRQTIGTLVASGLATSDGFSGLRALVWAARGRAGSWRRAGPRSRRRSGRVHLRSSPP